ncbi:hypothetical protein [Streptomyces lateritius]|uniref:hypothetical protein n=1 Tax=Streptomyces lateritius TaxID=67313 RepID=UPI001E57C77E|nr:hypothetical protein [Streptomyces lateritius]
MATRGGLSVLGATTGNPLSCGLLPGLLLLPAAAASFAGAAAPANDGVPPHRPGLAGGVLDTAMELRPTVLFAALLTLGGDASSPAATAVGFAALAALTTRVK